MPTRGESSPHVAHYRELHEVQRLTRRWPWHEQRDMPRRDGSSSPMAADARRADPQQHDRGRHHRARVPGADDSARFARFDELNADAHRAVALTSQGLDGAVLHLDDLRRVADVDRQASRLAPELVGDDVAVADERHRDRQLAGGRDGLFYHRLRVMIAAHGVDDNGFHGEKRRGAARDVVCSVLRDLDDLTAAVLPTVRAGPMPPWSPQFDRRRIAAVARRGRDVCCAFGETFFASVRPLGSPVGARSWGELFSV
jgi:hypothetical protein